MTNIKLPKYKSIIENKVYERIAELLDCQKRKAPATLITLLTKLKIPYMDEVINYIRASSQNMDLDLCEEISEARQTHGCFLKMLPALEIKNIAQGNKESLGHLKEHYCKGDFQDGRTYIHVINGVIPNLILEKVKKMREERGSDLYMRAMNDAGQKKWNLRVRLLEDGRFPDNGELEYLLDRGVKASDVFSVAGDFEDYGAVATQVRTLYNVLSSRELIAKIEDCSCKFLEGAAIETVSEVAKCIEAERTCKKIANMVGQVFMVLKKGGQGSPKAPFGDYGYNLN